PARRVTPRASGRLPLSALGAFGAGALGPRLTAVRLPLANLGRVDAVQVRVELDPEAVERHRQNRVRTDDPDDLHELLLVELLRQASPRVVVDAVAVEQLGGRGVQVGLQRCPEVAAELTRARPDPARGST